VFWSLLGDVCASSQSVLKLFQSVSEGLTFRPIDASLRQHRESTIEHTYYILLMISKVFHNTS